MFAYLKPHLLFGTQHSWSCVQLLHCEMCRWLFVCCPQAFVIMSSYILWQLLLWSVEWYMRCCLEASVTAARLHITLSTGYFKMLHRNYRSSKHRGTGVSSFLFITILTFWSLWTIMWGHTSCTRSNTVYCNLLTVIMLWWTYLVLKPSKIVRT